MTSAKKFFDCWKSTVNEQSNKDKLLQNWHKWSKYTSAIISDEDSIIIQVAKQLNLKCYERNYYSIDAILFKEEYLVPDIKENTFWFREIEVAFEHENNFDKNLYQEVSHLLITNCHLKVLVTYPNHNEEKLLEYMQKIIKGVSNQKEISEKENFLLIFGYEKDYEWKGLVYKENNWTDIK